MKRSHELFDFAREQFVLSALLSIRCSEFLPGLQYMLVSGLLMPSSYGCTYPDETHALLPEIGLVPGVMVFELHL